MKVEVLETKTVWTNDLEDYGAVNVRVRIPLGDDSSEFTFPVEIDDDKLVVQFPRNTEVFDPVLTPDLYEIRRDFRWNDYIFQNLGGSWHKAAVICVLAVLSSELITAD